MSAQHPTSSHGARFRRAPARRGVIFVTALAVVTILAGLVLVFAQQMRTEALASANQLSAAQADAIEQGAEQWVMGLVANGAGDAVTITQTPAEAIPLGGGYFWVLHTNPDSDQNFQFGVTDEQAKLNLNKVSADQLLTLTSALTQDVADAIVDWRNPASAASADGAETDYYQSLPDPYDCKNAAYETTDELLLVRGVTPQILFGYDANRNGVLDPGEQAAGGLTAALNSGTSDTRGLFPFVTAFSAVSTVQPPSTNPSGGRAGPATGPAAGTTVSPININTAPRQVLLCLPNLTAADVDAIIAARQNTTFGDTSWIAKALGQAKANAISPYFSVNSVCYSADIVAVSGDGRAFRRARIVVEASSPPKILYRRDLTGLGWPLTKEIRDALRSGKPPPQIGVQPNGFSM